MTSFQRRRMLSRGSKFSLYGQFESPGLHEFHLPSTCGPTTYDDAHLGHGRNYVSTDIIRRIMRDYFGLPVEFVMNITDVRTPQRFL
jgi:hypothetical protein